VTTALVIENDPSQGLGRAAAWLAEAGMELDTVRPHLGEAVPNSAGGHEALIALGGGRGKDWSDDLAGLLETAVADATPVFAICSSARMLAAIFGGTVADAVEDRDGRNGARMLAKRDAAGRDLVFGPAPMTLDVIRWRSQELVALPEEATLLAASPQGALEVFRIRDTAWGVQSHFEFTPQQLAGFGAFDEAALARAADVDEHIVAAWRPILQRFAKVAAGEKKALPVIDVSLRRCRAATNRRPWTRTRPASPSSRPATPWATSCAPTRTWRPRSPRTRTPVSPASARRRTRRSTSRGRRTCCGSPPPI
jgi:GMP synthase-like glutamine amidotransferase